MTTQAPRKRRPREHASSAANRQRIIDAALEVARVHGYLGATIPRVSRMANLPTGSVYWHFENKDMLFAALIEDAAVWLQDFHRGRRPLPGETTREHLTRIYCNGDEGDSLSAHDFWRLGVMLSIDKSIKEQTARERFLDLRGGAIAEYTTWYRQTLPEDIQEKCPNRAENLAKFTLICADGNLIMRSAGGSLDGYFNYVGTSLISLAESPPESGV